MKTKPTETALEESVDPVAADRSAAIEAKLQPLNQAAEKVRQEANALAEARARHSTRIANLKTQRADQETKLKTLEALRKDESVVDVAELENAIDSTIGGIGTLTKRLEKAESEAPRDHALWTAWETFKANFNELRGRIIRYHKNLAEQELAEIATIRPEPIEINDQCHMCGYRHAHPQTVPSRVSILFHSAPLKRAEGLTIGTPHGSTHVALAEKCMADVRVALEEITDLTRLGNYTDPAAKLQVTAEPPELPVVKRRTGPSFGPPAPEPGARSSLIYPTDHDYFPMVTHLQEAEERNAEVLRQWQEAGTAPRTRPL